MLCGLSHGSSSLNRLVEWLLLKQLATDAPANSTRRPSHSAEEIGLNPFGHGG